MVQVVYCIQGHLASVLFSLFSPSGPRVNLKLGEYIYL